MRELKTFNTYNQITKEFDIVCMNKQEIQHLNKNEQYLVLFPKIKKKTINKHKKTIKTTAPKWFREFVDEQRKFNQFVIEQFKTHGWIRN